MTRDMRKIHEAGLAVINEAIAAGEDGSVECLERIYREPHKPLTRDGDMDPRHAFAGHTLLLVRGSPNRLAVLDNQRKRLEDLLDIGEGE